MHKATHRFIGADEAPVDQAGCTVDRHDRSANQEAQKQVSGRPSTNPAELPTPLLFDGQRFLLERNRVIDGPHTRSGETSDPEIHAGARCLRRRRASVSSGSQAADVVLRPCGEDERDRGEHPGAEATTPQHEVNERPPCAPVAVDERMDGLELSVSDGRLGDRR